MLIVLEDCLQDYVKQNPTDYRTDSPYR